MGISIGPRRSGKYAGGPAVPADVARRRRSVHDVLRRMGTPMLHKHRYNSRDVRDGVAAKSPVFDDIYEQTRNRDPLSYGTGFVSVALSTDEWYDANGTIVKASSSPGAGWTRAPKYRGFGPGTLTYIIEPDRAEDFYKATVGGPIYKVQTAMAIAPWYPDIDDNDLLMNVTVNPDGSIANTHERFEAKNVNPVSIRGQDRGGRKEGRESFGNSFTVNQTFEMVLIPETDVAYEVEVDR